MTEHKLENAQSRIGQMLINKGWLNKTQLDLCLNAQQTLARVNIRTKIGEIISNYGFVRHVDIEIAMTELGNKAEGVDSFQFPLTLLKRIKSYPIGLNNGVLELASAETLDDTDKTDLIAAATELGLTVNDIEVTPKNRIDVLQALKKMALPDRTTLMDEFNEFANNPNDSNYLSKLMDHLYVEALQSRASDIHLFVSRSVEDCWIAYRIDGTLNFIYLIAPEVMSVVATRIKSDANIDYSDTSHPHDGRTVFKYGGRSIDVRVSTLPVDFGEYVVMRILDSTQTPSISKLFNSHPIVMKAFANIVDMQAKTGGIVLVTGATGSGKSTTLNAIIRAIDRSKFSIKTVEDPVELNIPLVGQTQINELAGLTYSKILRSILRQDPDIIMIGELRDTETVETALKAAETGHMVMTTLHTGSVSESVTRLIGMLGTEFRNIGKYIISGSLKGVVNQRLAKKICTKCIKESDKQGKTFEKLKIIYHQKDFSKFTFFESKGCNRCNNSGYYGRVIIPEAIFFGADGETRSGFEDILLNDKTFKKVNELPGVSWYSREDAVWSVLSNGEIDMSTAIAILDRKDS